MLLLAAVPWSASAQTSKDEELTHVIAKLRACVRLHAPAVQAAGMQGPSNAVNILVETCSPLLRLSELANPGATPSLQTGAVSLSDLADVGAVPPGLFRRIIGEEWARFLDQTRAR